MSYVELHCHSAFSLLDGASHPEALVERARALGMRALALTDHDDLGGAVSFAQAAHNVGLEAIIGVELTVDVSECGPRSADCPQRESAALTLAATRGKGSPAQQVRTPQSALGFTHLTLLAEDREGYGNIATLVTHARMRNPRGQPRVPLDVLAQHARGVFALTGCPRGWVPSLAGAGDLDGACAATATLLDIFDRRVAIECWDHHLPEERRAVASLVEIARALDIPWVVTNDVHYAEPRGRVVHDVLACLRHARPLDAMGTRLRPNGEWYLKGAEQMALRWQHAPEGVRATLAVAERCAFRLRSLRPSLPAFPLPPGVTADEYLARLVEQGAWERWSGAGGCPSKAGGWEWGVDTAARVKLTARAESPTPHSRLPAPDFLPDEYRRQIGHELDVIRRLGLAGYFLIVWDIVRFARREGVLCQGRGSAANSAVCFCLGITAVDPVKMGLLFERFLSEERQEAPDIDLDFAHQDRERVLQYVYERYGRAHAAMVCEQITYRGRSAVRDAARALGFSVDQANTLALLSDRFSARATAEAMGMGTGDLGLGTGSPPRGGESGSSRAGQSPVPSPPSPDWLVEALGSHLALGTEATRRANEVKRAARQVGARGAPPEVHDGSARSPESHHSDAGRTVPPPEASGEDGDAPSAPARRVPAEGGRVRAPGRVPSPDSLLARAGLDPADRRVRVLPAIVRGLHQIPRHRSIHVGGFVLTEEPLATVVPIEPAAMDGRTIVQWDKDDVEAVGLVKIDLLGLGMLTLIQECLKYIRRTRGETIELARLDFADQAVYDDLGRADTIGVFQVESRAQMSTLPRLRPRCFYDLVVEVALIRPGPIQGEMVHPYLRRRAGEEPVEYPHPSLEPILARTLGVPLFQEQGMQVAIACAGFTPGEADELRRAMGHKRSRERMAAICEKLIHGMARNGIAEDTARRIYNQINAFADYGFPESHAASFALLVYASAYLRHYYAPEFTAALLNAQPMGFYAPGTIIEDARRHGVVVLPVDVTTSAWDCTLEVGSGESGVGGRSARVERRARGAPPELQRTGEPMGEYHRPSVARRESSRAERARQFEAHGSSGDSPLPTPDSRVPAVRLGLRLVRGLGARARERLERVLAEGGPFRSIGDLVARAGLDRRALRHLAEAGALDAFVPDEAGPRRRRAAIWRLLDEARGDPGPLAPAPPRPEVPPAVPAMTAPEITAADYRMTGVSLNGHPMKHLRALLRPNGVRPAREVLALHDGARDVAVAGLVICRQRPQTAKGFVFLTLEDETGLLNVVVTPKRFERQALMLSTARLLLVRGTLQVEHRVVNLRGELFRELTPSSGTDGMRSHDFH